MGLALPSISSTSCPGGVSDWSRNIHRCGMKLRVTPLSGLYSRILMTAPPESERALPHVLTCFTARSRHERCQKLADLRIFRDDIWLESETHGIVHPPKHAASVNRINLMGCSGGVPF